MKPDGKKSFEGLVYNSVHENHYIKANNQHAHCDFMFIRDLK